MSAAFDRRDRRAGKGGLPPRSELALSGPRRPQREPQRHRRRRRQGSDPLPRWLPLRGGRRQPGPTAAGPFRDCLARSRNREGGWGFVTPPIPMHGCTVGAYAEAKRLPEPFLRELGISDYVDSRFGSKVLRVPYRDAQGAEVAVRLRLALDKGEDGADQRFLWRKGSRTRSSTGSGGSSRPARPVGW